MKPSLIDTDILSLFFRKNDNIIANFIKYFHEYDYLNISIITYYEILNSF